MHVLGNMAQGILQAFGVQLHSHLLHRLCKIRTGTTQGTNLSSRTLDLACTVHFYYVPDFRISAGACDAFKMQTLNKSVLF